MILMENLDVTIPIDLLQTVQNVGVEFTVIPSYCRTEIDDQALSGYDIKVYGARNQEKAKTIAKAMTELIKLLKQVKTSPADFQI